MKWQSFLKLGEGYEDSLNAPVGFGDTATLRYTSGTTGQPKGAAFDHANLRWMAETLASLPPWKARTRRVFYLSFLPMNHVVEGILASYAVYYAPAPVDVYYLESFHELQKMLPRVRPTVFFSIPRFYEKVWEKASQSFIGHLFLRSGEGLGKNLLGIILRLAVQKTAGIGRCAQLIVGSAPVSAGLLQNFRDIGIEIHNAYGLTEAPLITLNRFKANQIDTVGQHLPDTQIRIAADGEIMVSGPQVMKGYYEYNGGQPLENGWLHTGDLGLLADGGYLVLSGRKKEIMINSYGKNINPVKIELMLREATGINHVMVIGDNRPYCTALLWGCPSHGSDAVAAIGQSIHNMNLKLSHPEQVKKWAVLSDNLTIEGGDLTANLKIKRPAVILKYADVIEALYMKGKMLDGVSFGQEV
jgi:long-chain acyl-CoA synthetase